VSPEDFESFRQEACDALVEINELCRQEFKLGTWQHWAYELEAGTLTFSNDDVPRVIATIQAIGSTSNKSGTWMWGWANRSLPAKVTDQLYRLKQFGEREKLSQLTEEIFPGDEEFGWEMAAVATRILKGKGVYRCPSKNGFLFLVFMDICLIDTDRSSESKRAKVRTEITCDSRTAGFETFVCQHLVENPSQEWFSDTPTESNPWPDAWCTICNEAFKEQGEWNGQNESRMKIKLLCHRCYGSARAKKTRSISV
jgi:hypothetical protein